MKRHHVGTRIASDSVPHIPQSRVTSTPSKAVTRIPGTTSASRRLRCLTGCCGRETRPPKLVWVFGIMAVVFLLGVHVFLAQVYLSNEQRIAAEFSFPASTESVQQRWHPQKQPTIAGSQRRLTPLRDLDYEVYTIRINSWKRLDQLQASIQHHAACPGVVQIQIVWCIAQGEPPSWLFDHEKVVLERHEVNSLNERFHILQLPPTLGILSMDDDVLRPCLAIDAGFFKWTQNYDRMVGFDGRSHSIVSQTNKWEYAYLSETERTNQYSLTLPRYAFLHKDYLDWYMTDLPRPIFNQVAANFNCEDIAMSFFVSSLTNGKPPLLADKWASVGTQIKLFSNLGGISDNADHKSLRDACVDDFATLLHLKDDNHNSKLHYGRYLGPGFFTCGDDPQYQTNMPIRSSRQGEFEAMRKSWMTMANDAVIKAMVDIKSDAMVYAYKNGLIADSAPWEKRWNLKAESKSTKRKKKKNKKPKTTSTHHDHG